MNYNMVETYKNKFNKKYGFKRDEPHSLEEIAKLTGYKKKVLQGVFNRGVGAYKTNPSSVRPHVRSPEQWAYSRIYSFVMGGKAFDKDKDLLKK